MEGDWSDSGRGRRCQADWSERAANRLWDFHKIATIPRAHKGWWSKMSIERPLCGGKCLAYVGGQRSSLADWLTGATKVHQS